MAQIIDVHAHYKPRRYLELLEAYRSHQEMTAPPSSYQLPIDSDDEEHLRQRLRRMDEAGVGLQILSHAIASPYFEDEARAVDASRLCNDEYAKLVRQHPDRFRAFASLPLPHVDASIAELNRCFDELGVVGVTMNCSVFDRPAVEDEFLPIYEAMNRRNAILFFHPCVNGICSRFILDYGFEGSVGTSFEDTVLGLQLMAKQIPSRYPNIRIVIPHLGGLLPMLLERLDNQGSSRFKDLPEPMSRSLRRFYYDTVAHGSKAALQCAYLAFGAEHLLPGSDYPVLLARESYAETFRHVERADLPRPAVEQILFHTAQELFGSPS